MNIYPKLKEFPKRATGSSIRKSSNSVVDVSKAQETKRPDNTGALEKMVEITKRLVDTVIPASYQYKEFGQDAIETPAEGYRFPSPGYVQRERLFPFTDRQL
jgi:hypothetical protein